MDEANGVYHVLNRGNRCERIFLTTEEFEAFERMMVAALERSQARQCASCLLPSPWHMVVSPKVDGEVGRFGIVWRWADGTRAERSLLAACPIPRRPNWIDLIAAPLTGKQRRETQRSISRRMPFGDASWASTTVRRLGLESTGRGRDRPATFPKAPLRCLTAMTVLCCGSHLCLGYRP